MKEQAPSAQRHHASPWCFICPPADSRLFNEAFERANTSRLAHLLLTRWMCIRWGASSMSAGRGSSRGRGYRHSRQANGGGLFSLLLCSCNSDAASSLHQLFRLGKARSVPAPATRRNTSICVSAQHDGS